MSQAGSLVSGLERTTRRKRKLLEILSPFPLQGRLLLLESAGRRTPELCKRLLEGTYKKPFILDHGSLRYLHFGFDRVESLMHRDDPDALCLSYTRKMMAFLLFNSQPHRILLLGLGGGSLAKFCYRRLRRSKITVLEIDPNVMALREEFCVPSDDERCRVLQGDGVRYLAGQGPRKDVILVDAYDRHGVAPELATARFYHEVKRRLSLRGVLVVNVFGDADQRIAHASIVHGVFGRRMILLPVRNYDNLIILAFRTDATVRNWERLEHRASALKGHYGLDFPLYLRKMIRSFTATTLGAWI